MKKIFYRIFQILMKLAMNFMPWRQPELLKGENSCAKIPQILKEKGVNSVLIVADAGITKNNLQNVVIRSLFDEKIEYTYFDKTIANPTIENIEDALLQYAKNHCQAIIAIGGGSPMDCAKGVGARVANPKKTITQMRGLLKVGKKLPLLIAIPTTAGTGSETTLAAVITDSKTHEKFAINDFHLIPHFAVLDPSLTVSLPRNLTYTTGMDALTHAVEAFIGRSNTHETKRNALDAIKLINQHIQNAVEDGQNLESREAMQMASFKAGLAFTRAYVGNIHAVAHTLGGEYAVPHGLANAIILPVVLRYYGKCIYNKISLICDHLGTFSGYTKQEKTEKFIKLIEELNKINNVPNYIEELRKEDLPKLVKRAYKEANPLYPVPKIFDERDFENIYLSLIKKEKDIE
ncbi:MAG: iron-containing alcohol dehydrogenase [Clostridia bacterium]|nr:iron-containing alcohol dehydrogenase [Clostridia bacterium]